MREIVEREAIGTSGSSKVRLFSGAVVGSCSRRRLMCLRSVFVSDALCIRLATGQHQFMFMLGESAREKVAALRRVLIALAYCMAGTEVSITHARKGKAVGHVRASCRDQ